MKKLLQINVCSALLSTGKITEGISQIAAKHGWETYTAWGRFAKSSISTQIQIGSKLDTIVHYAANKLFDYEGLMSRKATRRFIAEIEKIKPDIIHLHNIHDHYLNYSLLFRYLAKIETPVVWTQHDCWAFTGGCMYYDLYNCEKWKNKCTKCPEHRALLCDLTEKHFVLKQRLLDKIKNITFVSVSDWLAIALRESVQKEKNVITIHNGIDTSVFKSSCKKRNDDVFRIIGVAAVWDKRKGLEDFIKLRTLLPSEYKITIVGVTHKQIKKLPKGIRGLTRTTNLHELIHLYSVSDVLVNPTYSDNFPTVNLEALACGTPVITYRTGGSPEAIDEKTGVVVEQGDVNALAEAIVRMKAQPLSSADCRKRAEECFDKDKCFERYVELYENLI